MFAKINVHCLPPYTLFLVLLVITACYSGEHLKKESLTGQVYVTGNEPFVQLAIETPDKKVYFISKDSPVYRDLWQNQGKVITVQIDNTKKSKEVFVVHFKIIK